jgi:hypothetical protein
MANTNATPCETDEATTAPETPHRGHHDDTDRAELEPSLQGAERYAEDQREQDVRSEQCDGPLAKVELTSQ